MKGFKRLQGSPAFSLATQVSDEQDGPGHHARAHAVGTGYGGWPGNHGRALSRPGRKLPSGQGGPNWGLRVGTSMWAEAGKATVANSKDILFVWMEQERRRLARIKWKLRRLS